MKNKIYHLIIILGSFAAMISLGACEKTLLNNMVDDRVYLSKPGLQQVNLYNFSQPVLELTVIKSGVGQRSANLSLSVNPEILQDYTSEDGKPFQALNPNTYSLQDVSIQLSTDDYERPFVFHIDGQKFAEEKANNPEVTLAIPCEVTLEDPAEGDETVMQTVLVPHLVEPYISFSESGVVETKDINSSSQASLSYNTKIAINYPQSDDVRFSVEVAEDKEDLIQQYNQEHGTNYIILPEDALSLESNGTIPLGVDYTALTFVLSKERLTHSDGSPAYGGYLLPLVINQVSENKIDPINQLTIIPFNYYE